MPTTPGGLPYPDDTDPPDVPADIEALGLALDTQLAAKQPLDADLTTIAGLTATTDNIIQSVGGAWASRTPTQVKTALELPGRELAYIERTTVFTTTATTFGTTISSLSVTVTGEGTPVWVDFFSPQVFTTVAGNFVHAAIHANAALLQFGGSYSPSTSVGSTLSVRARLVLTDGVSYTFTVSPWASSASTTTIGAYAHGPMWLAVTTR